MRPRGKSKRYAVGAGPDRNIDVVDPHVYVALVTGGRSRIDVSTDSRLTGSGLNQGKVPDGE